MASWCCTTATARPPCPAALSDTSRSGEGHRMRLRLMLAALVIAGALPAWQLSRAGGTGLDLPLFDFVEYWAAGHLNAHGENPYEHDRVEELEREAGRTEKPVLMWNPPWTLTLVMPFGVFSLDQIRIAQILWLLLQFAALVYSADALWR